MPRITDEVVEKGITEVVEKGITMEEGIITGNLIQGPMTGLKTMGRLTGIMAGTGPTIQGM